MRERQFIKAITAPLNRSNMSRGGHARRPIKRWAVTRLIAEAVRRPGFTPHVSNPMKPEVLSGCEPNEILPRIREAIAKHTRPDGARRPKLRPDKHIVICIVISYPIDKEVIEADPNEYRKFIEWAHASDQHQNEEWGARGCEPLSTIIHKDEGHYHLHKFMLPSLIPSFSARQAHSGCIAWKSTFAATADKDKAKDAYKGAMAAFQDRFFLGVSSKFGHERFGDRYARQTRSDAIRSNERSQTEARLNFQKGQELADREARLLKAERMAELREARRRAQRERMARLYWRARKRLSMARAAAHATVHAAKAAKSALLEVVRDLPTRLPAVAMHMTTAVSKLQALHRALADRVGRKFADDADKIVLPVVNDLNQLGGEIQDLVELLPEPKADATPDEVQSAMSALLLVKTP